MDGYVLRYAKSMLAEVGVIEFHQRVGRDEADSSDLAEILGAVRLSWGGGESEGVGPKLSPPGAPQPSDVSA